MKKIDQLDIYCEKIFTVLAVNQDPITFGKLFEKLQTEMTKPTLIKRLVHLQKNKIVKREKIGKQKVTYTITDDLINELEQEIEFVKEMEELKKVKETFDSFPMKDKIQYILLLSTLTEIDQLKNSLKVILDPNEQYKATLKHLYTKNTLEALTKYLLLNTLKSKGDVKEALNKVEEAEKNFWAKASITKDMKRIF